MDESVLFIISAIYVSVLFVLFKVWTPWLAVYVSLISWKKKFRMKLQKTLFLCVLIVVV